MRTITDVIAYRDIEIDNYTGLINVAYYGNETLLFNLLIRYVNDGKKIYFQKEAIEVVSDIFESSYSKIALYAYCIDEIHSGAVVLRSMLENIRHLESLGGGKVVCFDLLNGIQKYFDINGNELAVSTLTLHQDNSTLYVNIEYFGIYSKKFTMKD